MTSMLLLCTHSCSMDEIVITSADLAAEEAEMEFINGNVVVSEADLAAEAAELEFIDDINPEEI